VLLMGLGAAIIGVGATLLSKMLAVKAWTLINNDAHETMKGQFPPDEIERSVGSNWVEIQALNRQHAFLQFLNGKTETLSVQSRFFKRDMFDDSPVERLDKLVDWTQIIPNRRRPPLLTFILGDGLGLQMEVILHAVTGIKYSMPNSLGGIRDVSFTMEFMQVAGRQSAWAKEEEVTDTRYARAREGDYYELLAQQEYNDPMIGVVIAQRNPEKLMLHPGDIVALPALEGVRGFIPQPQSLIFKKAFGRKDTPEKRLRILSFNRHNDPYMGFLFTPPKR
jgi:hypothetical protein